jgi:hypothetical protein
MFGKLKSLQATTQLQDSTPDEFLSKVSKYGEREFTIITPYARKITLIEGPVNREDEPWVADFVVLPHKEVRYLPLENGKTVIGLPPTGYIPIEDFARHIAGNGCKEHANLKSKRIVLEGIEELYEGPGRVPLLKVSEAPVEGEVISKFKNEEWDVLDKLVRVFSVSDSLYRYRGYREYSYLLKDVEPVRPKLERARALLAQVIGHPVFRMYTLYEPLLGAMQAANLSIARVQHPARISLYETFSRSILEPRVIKLDPEFEIVFPENDA